MTIVSRTMAHAARTAEAIGGASAAPWDEVGTAVGSSDIVITATGAGKPVFTKAQIEAVIQQIEAELDGLLGDLQSAGGGGSASVSVS